MRTHIIRALEKPRMRIRAALTGLLLVLSIIACGCVSTTDYTYSGGNTQDTVTSSQASSTDASGAKFIRGDIIQYEIPSTTSDNSVVHNIALIITEVSGDMYQYNMVIRESPNHVWKKIAGKSDINATQNIEMIWPNKIGHVDPDFLQTVTIPTATPTATPTTANPGKLQILTHNLEYNTYGIVDVVGTAKNIGGGRISWGTVEAKFYDRDGNMIGNALDYVQDLDPGETWRFRAMYVDIDGSVHSYKLGVGTVW